MIGHWWIAQLTDPRRKALAAAALAAVFLAGAWWSGHSWHRQKLLAEMRGEVLAELDHIANDLIVKFNRRFGLLALLKAFVDTHASPTTFGADFESFARERIEFIGGIYGVSLAPGGVMRFVYPLADNEKNLGNVLLSDPRPEVRADVARAMQSRRIVISTLMDLRRGGVGVVGRLAVYRNDEFWGLINVAVDVIALLREAGVSEKGNLQMALRDSAGRVFFGSPAVFQSDPVIHRINLPEAYWELAAIPTNGWSGAIGRELKILDAGALSAVLLLTVLAYLIAFRDARLASAVESRTREIDSARRDLETELTERKAVEARLQAAEERYRHLVDFSPDAVLVNFQGRIVYVNSAVMRLFGAARREDLIGRSAFDCVPPNLRAEIVALNKKTLESGLPSQVGAQERTRLDGSIVHVETVAAPVAWEGGTAVQVIFRDVTELRKAEAWLRTLIETTQDALVSIDRQGRIVMFNPAAERMFGYARAEIAGQKVNTLMAEPYASEHDKYIERYKKTREARAIGRVRATTAKRKGGELFPIEISVSEMEGEENIPFAALIRDVSEKERLQAQLMESERLATIGATAAKIGHELANPVNGMSLTIQLLEQRLSRQINPTDDQTRATVKRLKDEIIRLNELTRQFREFVRKEKYDFRPTELRNLIDDVIKLQGPDFVERDIQVETVVSSDLPAVKVDGNKIKQVLLNLLKNAVEAMPGGGKITIEARATQDTVILEITDTGVGIPLDVDAFEPFMTTKKEGTGIGLVIVRQIVTAHGGGISYRSRPGQGTSFRIELPRN
ncbi:MAG: PAS domain S-box protein [Deltaproteobacteria bacterium]|nr:PAS domain S-box protein [Deltaproteobacteria bacterium]